MMTWKKIKDNKCSGCYFHDEFPALVVEIKHDAVRDTNGVGGTRRKIFNFTNILKCQNMKKHIIKSLLNVFAVFICIASFGQTNNRFFASYEDYKNDKFIGGYEIVDYSWVANFAGKESLKIITGGKTDRKKLAELPSELYTYDNKLNRTFGGDCHIVLHTGTICLYAWIGDNRGEYYSEGITGELKTFTQKYLDKLLSDHGLLESYKEDKLKRERRDTPSSYFRKTVEKDIKYLKLMEPQKSE
jgi:hypothetical protein